jgi:D-sedoheptulose 7-phosphate isomerase
MNNLLTTGEKLRLHAIVEDGASLRRRVLMGETVRIGQAVSLMVGALQQNHRILFCGNGGSAADAMHLAAELSVRFRSAVERRSLPGLALTLDPAAMSAAGNDYGFENGYARLLEGLGSSGDVLVALSTSGQSANVLKALEQARTMGIVIVGFLGGDGGAALPLCDLPFVVPSKETARVQEVHITLGHTIIEMVENRMFGN